MSYFKCESDGTHTCSPLTGDVHADRCWLACLLYDGINEYLRSSTSAASYSKFPDGIEGYQQWHETLQWTMCKAAMQVEVQMRLWCSVRVVCFCCS